MKIATIFTDGASRGNPGPGGWGSIISFNGEILEIGGRESKTTNNRMELTAVTSALSGLVETKKTENVIIFTDSSYVLNGSTKWIHGWKRNDWKKQDKSEVLNKDLWEKMDFLLENLNVEWNLVAGHAGVAGNERCDVIATSFADNNPIDLYSGPADKYFVDIKNIAPLAVNKDAKNRAKTKAYSYLSLINGELVKHSTWAECEERVRGVKGAKYRKSISPQDEMDIIAEWNGK
ncbi:MAG: ribonuclease HI [Candidatus Paceibacterota bacterium]